MQTKRIPKVTSKAVVIVVITTLWKKYYLVLDQLVQLKKVYRLSHIQLLLHIL